MAYLGNTPKFSNYVPDNFIGNGVQTTFILSNAVANSGSILVIVDGVKQLANTYSVSGTSLVFSEAPGDGTNIEVNFLALKNAINQVEASGIIGTINDFQSTIAATATTTPIWNSGVGKVQIHTGIVNYTAFPNAPQAGASRKIYPAAGSSITAGSNLLINGLASGETYTFAAGDSFDIVAKTTTQFEIAIAKGNGTALIATDKIQPITASVAANALTITLNPTTLDFRSATLGSGTINTRTVSAAISIVVSSGSTLGTINAVQNRLAVLAIDNAATVELAVVNLAGGVNLDETGVISTTAEGGAGGADSATVIYSTTARTNVPYRVVGFVESTQATAGTWATAPSLIQGYGGQAFAAMSSLGYGQTWQNLTASRSVGTTYYNTTGKPIQLAISYSSPSSSSIIIDGLSITLLVANVSVTPVVPPGSSYSSGGAGTGLIWRELR